MSNTVRPRELMAVLWICFSAFTAYHAPQPIFPAIRETFGISASTVTLMTTCVMFPFGLSPIIYGIFLNKFSLLRTLLVAQTIYMLALLPTALGGGWPVVIMGRLIQGFSLPAIILCAMTYISSRWEGRQLQQYMAWYSVSLMLGGFVGRIMAGFMEQASGDWRMAFVAMAVMVLSGIPCTLSLPAIKQDSVHTLSLHTLGAFFRQKGMLRLLCIAPCIIVANTSVLNILPFRLKEISPSISALDISIVYVGVILCSTVGIFSSRLIKWLGSEMRMVIFGNLLFLICLPLMAIPYPVALFFIMIILNFGYTFFYCCMPGIVARFSSAEKAVTSGVFLTFYYLSSAMGSYLPALVYEKSGFYVYGVSIIILTLAALIMAFLLRGIKLDEGEKSRG